MIWQQPDFWSRFLCLVQCENIGVQLTVESDVHSQWQPQITQNNTWNGRFLCLKMHTTTWTMKFCSILTHRFVSGSLISNVRVTIAACCVFFLVWHLCVVVMRRSIRSELKLYASSNRLRSSKIVWNSKVKSFEPLQGRFFSIIFVGSIFSFIRHNNLIYFWQWQNRIVVVFILAIAKCTSMSLFCCISWHCCNRWICVCVLEHGKPVRCSNSNDILNISELILRWILYKCIARLVGYVFRNGL